MPDIVLSITSFIGQHFTITSHIMTFLLGWFLSFLLWSYINRTADVEVDIRRQGDWLVVYERGESGEMICRGKTWKEIVSALKEIDPSVNWIVKTSSQSVIEQFEKENIVEDDKNG